MPDELDFDSFFADSTYDEVLDQLPMAMPRVATIMRRAHDHRIRKIRKFSVQKRLAGLDDLLGFLEAARDSMGRHPQLCRLAFLTERVRADYEMGIEAVLSEMRDVVFNSMRDVMEIEYLLIDFTFHPEHVDEWLNMPLDKPMKKFFPAELRKRQAKRLGIQEDELPTARDYKGHSRFLHANPVDNPMGGKGVLSIPWAGSEEVLSDSGFWDMYRHGVGIILVLREFLLVNGYAEEERIFSDDQIRIFLSANEEVRIAETQYFDELFSKIREQRN